MNLIVSTFVWLLLFMRLFNCKILENGTTVMQQTALRQSTRYETTTPSSSTSTRPDRVHRPPQETHRNEYLILKRSIENLNEQMDRFNNYYFNEMNNKISTMLANINSVAVAMRSLQGKTQVLESSHHNIDALIDRMNGIDRKLDQLKQTQDETASIDNKLIEMEHSLNHLHKRIDNSGYESFTNTIIKEEQNVGGNNNSDSQFSEQNPTCETKIDHVISFINSFAEINRLESSDILSRLSSIQTQLISFFDIQNVGGRPNVPRGEKVNKVEETNTARKTNNPDGHFSDLMNSTTSTENYNVTVEQPERKIYEHKRVARSSREDILEVGRYQSNTQFGLNLNESTCDRILSTCRELVKPKERQRNNDVEMTQATSNNRQTTTRTTTASSSFKEWDYEADASEDESGDANFGQPSRYGCHQFDRVEREDGVYQFQTNKLEVNQNAKGRKISERVCAFDENGIGWTVFQRRGGRYQKHIPENFNRSWTDYRDGFGDLNGEFWYGNEFIHRLTYNDNMELKIEVENWNGQTIKFIYDVFRVDAEKYKFNLIIGGFRGADKKMDSMSYHNNHDFSTYDRQHDKSGIKGNETCCSCAVSYGSGWWFNNCIEANLNGIYRNTPSNHNYVGIVWEHWLGDYSLKSTKMMIRPKLVDDTVYASDSENATPPPDP